MSTLLTISKPKKERIKSVVVPKPSRVVRRHSLRQRPVSREQLHTQVKLRSYARKKEVPLALVAAAHLMMFVGIVGATYCISSLAAHLLMEKVRREDLRTQEKIREMKLEVTSLRKEVDHVTSLASLEKWASLRGYVHDSSNPGPVKIVAGLSKAQALSVDRIPRRFMRQTYATQTE